MTQEITPAKELQPLAPFIGAWETKGDILTNPSNDPVLYTARDIYRWEAGGHILLHQFDADMPQGKVEGIEIIGYDAANKCYFMRSYDNSGNETLMSARNEGTNWYFNGENIRFKGGFFEGGKIFKGVWEALNNEEQNWNHLMNVSLSKVV